MCVHGCVHACMRVSLCVCVCVRVCAWVRACVHAHVHELIIHSFNFYHNIFTIILILVIYFQKQIGIFLSDVTIRM